MHKEWIEPALARHLDPVAAPEELWERVRNPRVIQKKRSVHTGVNAARLGACATALLVIFFLVPHRGLKSSDPGQIRGWVQAKSGIDVPLRARPAGVQLTGAQISKDTVEIAYKVGNRDGRLFIGGRHTASNPRVFTWSMHGNTYTLECATPDDLKVACNLCHIG
ncbi:MAG TPA: hypothetical protein VKT81_11135 [Bryobacteraceae bacterium]|nr:hypothetical protein [Bryobacteraceae bacterium]